MIIDKELYLSVRQSVTSSTMSTNTIDQVTAGDAYENELFFVVQTTTGLSGSGFLVAELQTSEDPLFTNYSVLFSSGEIDIADYPEPSTIVRVKMPIGAKRYIRAAYNLSDIISSGIIDAFFTPDVEVQKPVI